MNSTRPRGSAKRLLEFRQQLEQIAHQPMSAISKIGASDPC
jgi:hypothetical protein